MRGSNTWDGKYMIRWAAGARSSDRHAAVGGGAAVFADLLTTIFRDGPKVVAVSFVLTVLLLLCTFRKGRACWLALGAMLAGVLWMTGMLAIAGVKLNFLNLVAWPITFGIGVEYPVNYLKRYLEERNTAPGAIAARKALEGAGGAVILCSLTTLIGYISLYASTNRALDSFGPRDGARGGELHHRLRRSPSGPRHFCWQQTVVGWSSDAVAVDGGAAEQSAFLSEP